MKKSLVVIAAIAIVVAMVSGVWAAGSVTPSVAASGTVVTKCVAGGTAVIDFGSALEPTSTLSAVPMTGLTLWCTQGDSVTVTANNGGHYASSIRNLAGPDPATTSLIPYTIALTSPITGAGKSGDLLTAIGMTATISAGGLDAAPAGLYKDTMTLTIAY